jgi:hypothetical protein
LMTANISACSSLVVPRVALIVFAAQMPETVERN